MPPHGSLQTSLLERGRHGHTDRDTDTETSPVPRKRRCTQNHHRRGSLLLLLPTAVFFLGSVLLCRDGCVCLAQSSTLVNLISNPSFESTTAAAGTITSFGSSDSNPLRGGWRVSSQGDDVTLYVNRSSSSGGPVAFQGWNGMLLGSSCTDNGGADCSGGILYQSFTTTTGASYTVTLKVTGEATGASGYGQAVMSLMVADVGSRTAGELDDPYELEGDALAGWSQFEYSVSVRSREGDRLAWAQVGPVSFTAASSHTVLYLDGTSDLQQPALFVDMVEVLPMATPTTGSAPRFTWPIAASNLYLSGSAMTLTRGSYLIQMTSKVPNNNALALINRPFFLMNPTADPRGTSASKTNCTPLSFNLTLTYNSDRGGGAGLALVLTSDPSLGASGRNLGYARRRLVPSSVAPDDPSRGWGSIALELDAVRDAEVADISASHVGLNLHARGEEETPRSVTAVDTSASSVGLLFDGWMKSVWVQYDGGSKTLSVYMTRSTGPAVVAAGSMPAVPTLATRFNPCDVFAHANVPLYVGVAGATTGSRLSKQNVYGLSFAAAGAQARVQNPSPPPPPPPPPPPTGNGGDTPAEGAVVRVNARDAVALMQAALDWGLNFDAADTWLLRNPCGQWDGVTCDGQGNVVSLQLPSEDLVGPLPKSLSVLTSLTSLILGDNTFNSSIPDEWSVLTNLVELDLSDSSINGTLQLSPFTALTRLTYLVLKDNMLSGNLPDIFSALSSLERVDVCGNSLTGQLPTSIGSLTNLTFLGACDNLLVGRVPSQLQALPQLAVLYLSNNYLSGPLPNSFASPALADSSSTRYVRLDNNYFTGSATIQVSSQPVCLPDYYASEDPFADAPVEDGSQANTESVSGGSGGGSSVGGPSAYQSTSAVTTAAPTATSTTEAVIARRDRQLRQLLSRPQRRLEDTTASTDYYDSYESYLVSSIRLNCLRFDTTYPSTCTQEEQRNLDVDCSYFCGANETAGPCSGHGVCYLDGPSLVPRCLCDAGFTASSADQTDCSLQGPVTAPPPPPPTDTSGLTTGLTFLTTIQAQYRNRWSRYLSRGYSTRGARRSVWSIQSNVDWTSDFAPDLIFPTATDQGACGLCWAISAVDAISSAVVIARKEAITGSYAPLSVAQMVECQPGLNASTDVCAGGYPTNGLDMAAQSGLVLPDKYPTALPALTGGASTGRSCKSADAGSVVEKLVMYERVQFNGWFGMLLTLQQQPIMVSLQSSYITFRTYTGTYVYQDPNCYSGALDHMVLLVGYQLAAAVPYWIARNSWGPTWGDQGYMRLAIQGGDGVCGVNVLPALYPIPAPVANDPCYKQGLLDGSVPLFDPCGGGTCTPQPSLGSLSYTCTCPSGFVAANNTVAVTGGTVTQSCVPVDVCGLDSTNPCVVGNCINDLRGGYSCLCPPGYINTTFTDGSPTCAFVSAAIPTSMMTYTVQPQVTCYIIYTSYGLTEAQFLRQNPGLNCNALVPGRVVNVTNTAFQGCAVPYVATAADVNCSTIVQLFSTTEAAILAANPGLNCNSLFKGQQVCIQRGPWALPAQCTAPYQVQKSDTCLSIIAFSRPRVTPLQFFQLNPGINCDQINPPTGTTDTPGLTVCLAQTPLAAQVCKYGTYVAKLGDSCATVSAQVYFRNMLALRLCNIGMSCLQRDFYTGRVLCRPNPITRSCR